MAVEEELITPTVAEEEDLIVTLMPAAAAKIQALLAERNLAEHGLRVFVAGGGCSGMQYGMAIEKEPGEFDSIIESQGVHIYVDPTSMMYLTGATVDYVDNLMGGGFRIDNPNAVSTCGCGHSFRTTGSAGASSGGCGH
ncbi:MAG: iron-sulfur cluster insertion protein ErpA [Anaerolineales bacterium]|nr:iron-sulfur cluster insertion protein ErpA [Anaerolineales bacterium]